MSWHIKVCGICGREGISTDPTTEREWGEFRPWQFAATIAICVECLQHVYFHFPKLAALCGKEPWQLPKKQKPKEMKIHRRPEESEPPTASEDDTPELGLNQREHAYYDWD